MAYTIVQTAGKRATSGWPILMPTDSDHTASGDQRAEIGYTVPAVQIVSTLDDDPRLLIGAGTIAGHAAQEAGLTERAQEHLITATTEACDEVFALAHPDPQSPPALTLTASRFPDRVEIAVELTTAPTDGKAGSTAKKATARDGHGGKPVEDGLVDHVRRETHDGRPSIVLVKYYRPVKSKA